MDHLTRHDLICLGYLGPVGYLAEVIDLFTSDRPTPALWQAMAQAVLHVSESSAGALVRVIDRAILDHLKADQERRIAAALQAYLLPEEPEEDTSGAA